MNIDDVRSKAPQGATHYSDIDGDIVYYQKTNNVIYWDDEYKAWDEVYFDLPEIKPLN